MNKKDYIILTAFSLFVGILLLGKPTYSEPLPVPVKDTSIQGPKNVEGYQALFIGDSHTIK